MSTSGDLGQAARTPDLPVGLPGAPTITAVTAGLGQSTIAWTAPAYNARIGCSWSLQLLNGAGAPAGSAVELAATPVGAEGTAFTATHAVLPPGVYSYKLLTENAYGDGAPSAPSAPTRSRECLAHLLSSCAAQPSQPGVRRLLALHSSPPCIAPMHPAPCLQPWAPHPSSPRLSAPRPAQPSSSPPQTCPPASWL